MDKLVYLSLLLAFLAGAGLSTVYFSNFQPEITINRTGEEIFDENYIQANNHEINYFWKDKGIKVSNIDLLVDVNGNSMRPTMFTDHTALAREFKGEELNEGTIIYTKSGLIHRINADYTETDGYYLTRGDNNIGAERVKPEEIDFVVVGVLYTED